VITVAKPSQPDDKRPRENTVATERATVARCQADYAAGADTRNRMDQGDAVRRSIRRGQQ
jgi:hypothetical protein